MLAALGAGFMIVLINILIFLAAFLFSPSQGILTQPGWLAHCERLHPKSIDMTLARVSALRDRLGLAFRAPVVTVAGTNGKGSTCAMLESIALAAGYRVGLYIKPHLVHFEERCRVNGRMVDAADLLPHFERVRARQGIAFTVAEGEDRAEFALPVVGDYNVANLLCALAVLRVRGLSEPMTTAAPPRWRRRPGGVRTGRRGRRWYSTGSAAGRGSSPTAWARATGTTTPPATTTTSRSGGAGCRWTWSDRTAAWTGTSS